MTSKPRSRHEILSQLNLGSSVAENDDNLASYFIQTTALHDFISDKHDLIRGAKGSGKSAILKVVSQQQSTYPELDDTILNVAIEHTGEPSFKRAFDKLKTNEATDAELSNAWKTYIINLALDSLETLPEYSEARDAINYATQSKLRYKTTNPFKKIWWSLLRMLHIKRFEVGAESVAAEFPDTPPEFWTQTDEQIDFPEALRLCVRAFSAQGKRCWLLLDRLDAAFQDNPELERRALRSLLIAYKDFMGQKALRPKLFFRTDLFEQVVSGQGFRELTHVLDRTSPPISWDTDRLLHMIIQRFAFNDTIRDTIGFSHADTQDPDMRELIFYSIFPGQIDIGERKPNTWTWICGRIRDGNNVRTPRDLHALIKNSANKQVDLLSLDDEQEVKYLIGSAAVKSGLSQLSADKIYTTLVAENPDMEPAILSFKKQKAEQNENTLPMLLGKDWQSITERLVRIGFLEKTETSWKVPMLYRDGLEILQGTAF